MGLDAVSSETFRKNISLVGRGKVEREQKNSGIECCSVVIKFFDKTGYFSWCLGVEDEPEAKKFSSIMGRPCNRKKSGVGGGW